MRNRLMALLLAAAMVLALAACTPKVTDPEAQEPQGSQSDPAPAPTPTPGTDPAPAPAAEPKVMRFADIEDIRSVNPHTGNYLSENSARAYLSARLFRDVVDPETLGVTYVPEMAAELPIQADDTGTVWIIKLGQRRKDECRHLDLHHEDGNGSQAAEPHGRLGLLERSLHPER